MVCVRLRPIQGTVLIPRSTVVRLCFFCVRQSGEDKQREREQAAHSACACVGLDASTQASVSSPHQCKLNACLTQQQCACQSECSTAQKVLGVGLTTWIQVVVCFAPTPTPQPLSFIKSRIPNHQVRENSNPCCRDSDRCPCLHTTGNTHTPGSTQPRSPLPAPTNSLC